MRKLFVSLVAVVPLLVITGLACQAATSEGLVDHKSITGSREGTSYTVLINRPSDEGSPIIAVDDRDLVSHFAIDEEHAIVSDSLEFEIESRYDRIDYFVNIRLTSSTGSGTQPYRVTREVFNQLKVGETVKFKTKQSGDFPEIEKLMGTP